VEKFVSLAGLAISLVRDGFTSRSSVFDRKKQIPVENQNLIFVSWVLAEENDDDEVKQKGERVKCRARDIRKDRGMRNSRLGPKNEEYCRKLTPWSTTIL
jgi:hypothetical protein